MTLSWMTRILPPILIAIVILVIVQRNDNETPEPIHISARSPSFSTLQGMIDDSDVIVIARATDTTPGRVVGADSDTSSGVRTHLVTLRVGEVLRGTSTNTNNDQSITLEEETELIDGTPIIVNGVQPTAVGDEGLFFLTTNPSQELPYFALVNHQSRYLVTGTNRDQLTPAVAPDVLGAQLAAMGPYELRCQILALDPNAHHCEPGK